MSACMLQLCIAAAALSHARAVLGSSAVGILQLLCCCCWQVLQLGVTAQLAELQQQLEEGRAAALKASADKAALTGQLAAAERVKGACPLLRAAAVCCQLLHCSPARSCAAAQWLSHLLPPPLAPPLLLLLLPPQRSCKAAWSWHQLRWHRCVTPSAAWAVAWRKETKQLLRSCRWAAGAAQRCVQARQLWQRCVRHAPCIPSSPVCAHARRMLLRRFRSFSSSSWRRHRRSSPTRSRH